MNSKVLVAFHQKLKSIYEEGDAKKNDRFLCLPKESTAYFSDEIELLTNPKLDNLETYNRDLNTIFEFSHKMNVPIKGNVALEVDSEDNLWTVYHDAISKSVMAAGVNDSVLNENYKKARELLYDDSGDYGVVKPIYEEYNKYRDMYFTQEDSCNMINNSLNLAESKEEREAILAELERARQNLQTINQDWLTNGHKLEVETAIKNIELYAASQPEVYRKNLTDSFDTEIDTKTNGEKGTFATTYLYPSGFEKEEWDCLYLSGEEVKELYENAPDNIKALCDDNVNLDKISEVSIEYRSVRVERPWLNTKFLESRNWYFPKTSEFNQISYADELSLGRFPAFISAVLMYRNLDIVNKEDSEVKTSDASNSVVEQKTRRRVLAGKRVLMMRSRKLRSFAPITKNVAVESPVTAEAKAPTPAVEEAKAPANEDVKNEFKPIAILSYICKKLPDCPNPNPSENWGDTFEMSLVSVSQVHGGTLRAYVGSNQILSSYLPRGTALKFVATPDIENGYVIKYWRVNGENIQCASKVYETTLGEEDLQVEVVWDKGVEVVASYKLSKDKKKLSSWNGPDPIVFMDSVPSLASVDTITKDAFRGNSSLQRISIGSSVKCIESQAFANCDKLEMVDIPEETTIIDQTAFLNSRKLEKYPNFSVSENNPAYTTLYNHLIEKNKTVKLKSISCMKCGFTAVFKNNPGYTKCPKCSCEMNADKVTELKTIRPDYIAKTKFSEAEVTARAVANIKSKTFALSEFKGKFITEASFNLVYVPSWLYDVSTIAKYKYTVNIPAPAPAASSSTAASTPAKPEKKTIEGSLGKVFKRIPVSSSKFGKAAPNVVAEKFSDEVYSQDALVENFANDAVGHLKQLQEQVERQVYSAIQDAEKQKGNGDLAAEIDYSNLTFDSVLYPLWTAMIEFEGSFYRAIVDGFNGSVDIEYPKDKKKVLKTAGIVAAVVLVITLLILILK
ncbi:MAG: leucine-rich repeat domain-containing protein [Fibrobacter sp.]|nr:leucine-rich repeat domain-containing protein [Fibrobacter sp.]